MIARPRARIINPTDAEVNRGARWSKSREIFRQTRAFLRAQRFHHRRHGHLVGALIPREGAHLVVQIFGELPRETRRWRLSLVAALLLGLAGGGSVMQFVMREKSEPTRLAMLMVDDHRRALLAREPIDVASSDRHTVKPWFDARLAISPPVVDLAAQGIELVGGRADVVEGIVAPTLVYRQREHLISVTALPSPRFTATPAALSTSGYEALSWSDRVFVYWAVSDLPRADLDAFALVFQRGATANENAR